MNLRYHSAWHHIAAPIWTRVPSKCRWRIVHWLDRSRRLCWSDLVAAALTQREEDACDTRVPAFRGERMPRCASVCDWSHPGVHEGEHACSCYCGKFEFLASEGYLDRKGVS